MKLRTATYVIFGLFSAGAYAWAVILLPAFGNYNKPYGNLLNHITLYERHATNVVTTVVFDYRGFDTLNEEFMLFIAVVGVLVLFRHMPIDQQTSSAPEQQSDAVRTFVLGLVSMLALFSFYMILTGHLTPGGGFQGGVMFATAFALIYLSGSIQAFLLLTPKKALEVGEAICVGGLALYGVVTLALGHPFLQNVLPLGESGHVLSAGSLPLLNLLTGIAVSMGMVLLIRAYLREVLEGGDGDE
jgi:multicomponent Na+:H+ antiporter subunit B